MEDSKAGSESMDQEQEAYLSPEKDRNWKSVATNDDHLVTDPKKVGECSQGPAVNLSKRKKREESEVMDAETQRLLRESKKVAFPEEQLQHRPISSVLEKMRQRKLQRAQKGRPVQQGIECSSRCPVLDKKKALSDDKTMNVDLEDDFELVMVKPPTQQVFEIKQEHGKPSATSRFRPLQNVASFFGLVKEIRGPSSPETRSETCPSDKASVFPTKGDIVARLPLIDSQDLYSDSQLSPIPDEAPDATGADGDVPLPELDSDTQTECCSSREEDDTKENKDPTRRVASFPTVSLVRGLIDDEAEDEDEDLLEDEEEEDEDAADDLRDMLAHDVTEKPADRKRRDDLHRKWLQEQDMSLTDSLLNRIENGWKNRAKKQRLPGVLDEAEANDNRGGKSRASHDTVGEPAEFAFAGSSIRERPENQEVKRDNSSEREEVMKDTNTQEFDDEEEDEKFRRQRLLSESEEQSELPSVHDDESSRQIFSLINKVNVATNRTTKSITGINDIRPLGMVHHHSLSHVQSSFAHRTVTTSAHPTTRHGSGNSRSYIFGRDDSNSNNSVRLHGNELKSGNDPSPAVTAGDNEKCSSRISPTPRGVSSGTKGSEAKAAASTGPSLFQILKQQAADLERSVLTRDTSFSLNRSSSSSGDLSIFSVMRPSKPSPKSRG